MATYTIQKKTPASNWMTIHKNYDEYDTDEFLKAMIAGGFDKSGVNGSGDLENGTAQYFDEGGDLIQYRAMENN